MGSISYEIYLKRLSVGRATKNIQDVYLDRALALRTAKKWFCQFRNVDFNLNDKIRSGRPSGIHNDLIHDLVNNNPQITTEEIAEKLNVDNSTLFILVFTIYLNLEVQAER